MKKIIILGMLLCMGKAFSQLSYSNYDGLASEIANTIINDEQQFFMVEKDNESFLSVEFEVFDRKFFWFQIANPQGEVVYQYSGFGRGSYEIDIPKSRYAAGEYYLVLFNKNNNLIKLVQL